MVKSARRLGGLTGLFSECPLSISINPKHEQGGEKRNSDDPPVRGDVPAGSRWPWSRDRGQIRVQDHLSVGISLREIHNQMQYGTSKKRNKCPVLVCGVTKTECADGRQENNADESVDSGPCEVYPSEILDDIGEKRG
ncbi:MAG: hypothetical protein J07HN6_00244 [Halonotius sp. J07HN6]|nr:MAG: hypothetical protein J07HN6_00244 [Halonotius sp. J07HN6]